MDTLEQEVEILRQLVLARIVQQVDGEIWLRLDAFCTMTGYPECQVREFRKNGVWPDGVITQVRRRRIHVNLPAYNHWVKTGRVPLAA